MSINTVQSPNLALSLLKGALSGRQNSAQAESKELNSILALLEQKDPAKADAFRREQAALKQTISQLQSSRTDQSEQRKEAARQKIEQLKAQIQALRMMAAANPKAAARQAARLARELAAAAKDYAGAGGGGVSMPTIPAAAPASATTATAATDASATTGTETATASATEAVASVPVVAAEPATDTPASTESAAAPDVTSAEIQADELAGDVTEEQAADKPTLSQDEIKSAINEANKQLGAAQADSDFAREARRLMNELKMIIKAAKEKMQADGDTKDNADIARAETALRETEQSLNEITAGALSTTVTVNINLLA